MLKSTSPTVLFLDVFTRAWFHTCAMPWHCPFKTTSSLARTKLLNEWPIYCFRDAKDDQSGKPPKGSNSILLFPIQFNPIHKRSHFKLSATRQRTSYCVRKNTHTRIWTWNLNGWGGGGEGGVGGKGFGGMAQVRVRWSEALSVLMQTNWKNCINSEKCIEYGM